jgi:hypothetical protein
VSRAGRDQRVPRRETPHGRGAALDFALLDPSGRATWAPEYVAKYEAVGHHAEQLGLEWGGRFPKPDRPHVQLAHWRTLPA